jgi:replication initiation protein RepC
MESGYVTTPFGRRPMTLGMLASQMSARQIEPDRSVDKWKLYRAICEAKPMLGVSDRALAVLNALLSFYPKSELSQDNNLVVFPSNAQLSLRSHGMAEQTIRRHLAALIEAGLLIRKDSPNGKRYARKNRAGEIYHAFGFSLAPLLARAPEIERLASQVMADRLHLHQLREQLTLCRRDIAKLIEAAIAEGASGNWEGIHQYFRTALNSLPRAPAASQVASVLDELELLRDEILNQLEMQIKVENSGANDFQTERHIQNSDPDSITESEPSIEVKQNVMPAVNSGDETRPADPSSENIVSPQRPAVRNLQPVQDTELKSFPLGLVLQACPDISTYGPGGAINHWRDLMSAAVVVRSMLGVSSAAYQEACEVMGQHNAATIMACLLERAGHINSAGGYLRDLTRRAERGEFAIGPMLMALARSNGPSAKKTG